MLRRVVASIASRNASIAFIKKLAARAQHPCFGQGILRRPRRFHGVVEGFQRVVVMLVLVMQCPQWTSQKETTASCHSCSAAVRTNASKLIRSVSGAKTMFHRLHRRAVAKVAVEVDLAVREPAPHSIQPPARQRGFPKPLNPMIATQAVCCLVVSCTSLSADCSASRSTKISGASGSRSCGSRCSVEVHMGGLCLNQIVHVAVALVPHAAPRRCSTP